MYQMHADKVSVAKLDRYLARLRQQVRRSARHLLLFQVSYFLGLLGLFALFAGWVAFGAIPLAFVTVLFTWGFYRRQVTTHELRQRRLTWLDALLRSLRDDLAPTEKLRVRYGVQPSDSWLNAVKSTKSAAGNTKRYYRDRWLRVRCVLADGTRVRIRMQSAAKRKKGTILREQSTLILQVTPPAGRYASAASTAPGDASETRPWSTGSVTMEPAHGRLVFRCQAHEGHLLDQLHEALRYTMALFPAQPDAGPAPGSPA
jgi:hypothetical protein